LRVCVYVVEKAATNENAARRTREKRPIIRRPSVQPKVATLRTSCPSGREKKREKETERWEGKGTRARALREQLPRDNECAARVSASD